MISTASATRYDIEKFDEQNDFGLWKMKMRALLRNLGLEEALKGETKMLASYFVEEKKEIGKKSFNT